MITAALFIFLIAFSSYSVSGFQLNRFILTKKSSFSTSLSKFTSLSLSASTSIITTDLPPVNPGPLSLKIKGKMITGWGLLYALSTLMYAIVVLPFMLLLATICDIIGEGKRRKILDWMVHFWANMAMSTVFFRPKVIGLENLPPSSETVMYVPNHTSFMDILVLSGFVPRPFKYLSKIEIMKIPIIGLGMKLAKHVFLKRDDIQNAFECNDICTQRLLDGNSMVLFAEGTRSLDGRLKSFKKGAFQMAKRAGVRVVPVSLANLHRWMPPSAALPLAPMRNVYIKIHPPIETANRTVSEIKKMCFEAVNEGLPEFQKSILLPAAKDITE
jgi:1-acyl-sn-glycerol-3-phosphate acyltransferase